MTGTDVLDFISAGGDIVTVCCHCSRVRTTEGRWEVRELPSGRSASHGICRDCFAEFYPDVPIPPNVR
jgi:hypothetical protein